MPASAANVAALRAFNRFHTRLVGALDRRILDSPHSLTELRILFEIAHSDALTAAELAKELRLDPAYLSRALGKLADAGLIEKRPSATDGRALGAAADEAGAKRFRRARPRRERAGPRLARTAARRRASARRRGDDRRHGGVEGRIGAPERFRPARARARRHRLDHSSSRRALRRRIRLGRNLRGAGRRDRRPVPEEPAIPAERALLGGRTRRRNRRLGLSGRRRAGDVAKLRLLYVEPDARGLGLGRRLVEESAAIRQAAGYRSVTLWTNDVLVAARRIYEAAGFRLVSSEPPPQLRQGPRRGELGEGSLTRLPRSRRDSAPKTCFAARLGVGAANPSQSRFRPSRSSHGARHR